MLGQGAIERLVHGGLLVLLTALTGSRLVPGTDSAPLLQLVKSVFFFFSSSLEKSAFHCRLVKSIEQWDSYIKRPEPPQEVESALNLCLVYLASVQVVLNMDSQVLI